MNVKELIEMLKHEDPTAEVHFSYNSGDHWRTHLAPTVDSVSVEVVEYSEYHRMDKVLDDEDCYDEETGDYKAGVRNVVILS